MKVGLKVLRGYNSESEVATGGGRVSSDALDTRVVVF